MLEGLFISSILITKRCSYTSFRPTLMGLLISLYIYVPLNKIDSHILHSSLSSLYSSSSEKIKSKSNGEFLSFTHYIYIFFRFISDL